VVKSKKESKSQSKIRVMHPDAAGIDIGSQSHWVAVPADRAELSVREFSSFTGGLHKLADWLAECGIKTVAMESTGVYWVPAYEVLQERGFDVILVHAAHVRNVPGRKSDVMDCQWIQDLHSHGLLRASFRPDSEFVELRSYVRQRQTLLECAASHIQHMQKALMLMNVQVHHVIADITGVTGMHIIRAIVKGEREPNVLATHRDPRCRATEEEIANALTGNYKNEHVFALKQALSLYDAYQAHMAECDIQIENALNDIVAMIPKSEEPQATTTAPTKCKLRIRKGQPKFDILSPLHAITGGPDLTTIPGIAALTALNLLAEIGTNMDIWPTEKHFTAWLNLAPGMTKTGGKMKSGRRPTGKNRAGTLLRQAAVSVGKTSTSLGAFYRRIASRRGKGKAVVATARKIAIQAYHVLKHGRAYSEESARAHEKNYEERKLKFLTRQAKALGLELHPISKAA
jgi:transposase